MKIFIICCLLFIHVNMCIFIHGFRVSIRVSDIRGFGFGDGFPLESVSGSGFGFGCTETPPDPNPTRCHPYRSRPPFPMPEVAKVEPPHPPLSPHALGFENGGRSCRRLELEHARHGVVARKKNTSCSAALLP